MNSTPTVFLWNLIHSHISLQNNAYEIYFVLRTFLIDRNKFIRSNLHFRYLHSYPTRCNYIDGIRVRGSRDLPIESLEEVTVITGGLPVNYGDLNSSIILINTALVPAIPQRRISDKEQKMPTE